MKKLTNSYYLKARLFPSVLTVIPVLVFINYMINAHLSAELSHLNTALPLVTSLGISAALVFLMVQVNRIISKELFERIIFRSDTAFPTTEFLMPDTSHLSSQIKTLLIQKIHSRYGIVIPISIDNTYNDSDTRLAISTAVSQIRNELRDNSLLLQHNIEYGFVRNLLGGTILALLFTICSLVAGFYYDEVSLVSFAFVMLIIYSIPLLLCNFLVRRLGRYYAKVLYEQFLSLPQ